MNKQNKNIAFVGLGVIALYFLLKPKTTYYVPGSSATLHPITPAQTPTQQLNNLISSSSSLVGGLSSLFGGSAAPSQTNTAAITPAQTIVSSNNYGLPTVTAPEPSLSIMPVINPYQNDATSFDGFNTDQSSNDYSFE